MKRILSFVMIVTVFVTVGCKHHDETNVLNIKINGESYSIPLKNGTEIFGMRNIGTDLTTNALRCSYRCVKIQ